jgi:hypothetical protein
LRADDRDRCSLVGESFEAVEQHATRDDVQRAAVLNTESLRQLRHAVPVRP